MLQEVTEKGEETFVSHSYSIFHFRYSANHSNAFFKWAWEAQFLSHTPVTLKSYVFFIDVQMILVSFFKIPNQKPDFIAFCTVTFLKNRY
jgi:hypothetical protein